MVSAKTIQQEDKALKPTIAANIAAVQKQLSAHTTLIAVSKKQPMEKIAQALNARHRVFGENYVQEAADHWGTLKNQYTDLRLHLIGPLQTNKVKQAIELFDVIHTLDRPKLAEALAQALEKKLKKISCFIQVNTGEEPQKAGILPADLPAFYALCQKLHVPVVGLMCIPPIGEPAGLHFALLKTWVDRLGLTQLSMGMSDDWQQAVKAGATHIRLGTALFGARE